MAAPGVTITAPAGRFSRRRFLRAAVGLAGMSALAGTGCGGLASGSERPRVKTSTEAYPDTGFLANVDWLAERIGDPALSVIDCSPIRRYRSRHIPTATHVWWQDTIELHNPTYGMLAGAPQRETIIRDAGITPSSTVVAYDDRGGQYASRIVWMLNAVGFDRVRLLDGGRQAWQDAGFGLTSEYPDPPPGSITEQPDESILAHGGDIANRLDDPNLVLLDTRTAAERTETWYDRLRRGVIPGSHWLPRTRFLTDDGLALVSPDVLRARLSDAGVPLDGFEIIVYGLHGTLAALPWVALKALGVPHVRVYDGSWAEWGANPGWPAADL